VFKLILPITLALTLVGCGAASSESVSPSNSQASEDVYSGLGDLFEYEVGQDGSLIFEAWYSESDGPIDLSEEPDYRAKQEYYYFRIGCYPQDNLDVRLRGEFALQPASGIWEDAYTTDVFGDAQDFKLTLGADKQNAIPTFLVNLMLASNNDNKPPYSYIYFTPEVPGSGTSVEFASVLSAGEVELTANGKTVRFSWPENRGPVVLEKLKAAGC
jgi:hypothetical protein